MISPVEIKEQALKWWKPLLQRTINGEAFFPKALERIGKVQAGHITQRFEALQNEIENLYRYSKNQTGSGYLIQTVEKSFRRTGNHELPDAIVFEKLEDYLSYTAKKNDWSLFMGNLELVRSSLPQLYPWLVQNCLWLADKEVNWPDILKVCHYFVDTPRPDLYLRQLPISVHTKFIEEHNTLIQSLLDFLIPDHIRNTQQRRFAERYFLRYDEPLIRMRLLDIQLSCFGEFADISIPLSDFEKLCLPAQNILIAENKMNFLTLPLLPSTVAVWSGGGFNISYLKNARWLLEKRIFYWGDLDEHGFQILHQLRMYFLQAKSVMMDSETFLQFAPFVGVGPRTVSLQFPLLSNEERQLFGQLKSSEKNRLEQEKIPQVYVEERLAKAISS